MGCFVSCPPTFCLFLVSKHSMSFEHFLPKIAPVLCPNSLHWWLRLSFVSEPNNHCTCCKREGQRRLYREKEPKGWGANNRLKFTENLYKENISIQTRERWCVKIFFPYLHLQKNYTVASTLKFRLLLPKAAQPRRKDNGKVNHKSRGLRSWWSGWDQGEGARPLPHVHLSFPP